MPIDEASFRQTMGYFASGVTVVTAAHQQRLYGMTVSSFASLSLEPPLVLVCIQQSTPTHTALLAAPYFAVNVLAADQEALSRQFASRRQDKFAGVAYTLAESGSPLLGGALATIECRRTAQFPGGDHTIIVGEVLSAQLGEGAPLLYYRSGYRQLAP